MSIVTQSLIIDKLIDNLEELKISTSTLPPLKPSQVHVKVHSIGANFFDILMCQGKYQHKPALPFIPGSEFAGEIITIGEKVKAKHLKVGTRVCGFIPNGAYTQDILCESKILVPIPDNMSYDQAAGFIMTYATAYFTLIERAKVTEDDIVLVHAAAGGVGSATVQIAKALGCKVIGTVGSDEKKDFAIKLGCDHVLNYSSKDWAKEVMKVTDNKGATVICDSVGGDIFQDSLKCIAWSGKIMIVGFAGGKIADVATNRILLKNISIIGVFFGSYQKYDPIKIAMCVKDLFKMFSQKKIDPLIGGIYPLENVVVGLKNLASRKTVGKIIFKPNEYLNQKSKL